MRRALRFAAVCFLLGAGFAAPGAAGEEPKARGKQANAKKVVVKRATARAMAGLFKAAAGEQGGASRPGELSAEEKAEYEVFIVAATPQYRQILISELELLRNVCDLTPEQRPKIRAAGEASLKQSLSPERWQASQRFAMSGGSSESLPKLIQSNFQKSLVELLTPEQMAAFAKRREQRTARRKRATILSVVARLDAALYLSAEQRDKLTAALAEAPGDSWEDWSGMANYQQGYLPDLPDERVAPYLNSEQAAVRRDAQKLSFGGGMVIDQNEPAEIDDWWGPSSTQPVQGIAVEPSP